MYKTISCLYMINEHLGSTLFPGLETHAHETPAGISIPTARFE